MVIIATLIAALGPEGLQLTICSGRSSDLLLSATFSSAPRPTMVLRQNRSRGELTAAGTVADLHGIPLS